MIIHGCALEKLKEMPDDSVDAVVTDPPYGIKFMGKKWDYDIPSVELWAECLRVLKPGGHMLVACGTRTQHRMVMNVEDAGFEIRDVITWLYGSGFPKSLDISKAIDKAAGAERGTAYVSDKNNVVFNSGKGNKLAGIDRTPGINLSEPPSTAEAKQWQGWGTALKPACEFWTLARKPLSESTVAKNVLKHGTGGINVDGCRVESESNEHFRSFVKKPENSQRQTYDGARPNNDFEPTNSSLGRFPANLILDEYFDDVLILKDSLDASVYKTIEEYFYGYSEMPELRIRLQNVSKSSDEPKEILQPSMLLSGLEETTGSNGRQETFSTINSQDESASKADGQTKSKIQRQVDEPWVCDDWKRRIDLGREGEIPLYAPTINQDIYSGAQIDNGAIVRPSTQSERNSSSPQRCETRQSTGESRANGSEPSQERTLGGFKRSSKTSIVVRECDVPQMWRGHFEETGLTLRSKTCAAEMLDEQSGVTKSSAAQRNNSASPNVAMSGANLGHVSFGHSDSGGASRFFYCAKASKSERNAGLEGMPEKYNDFQRESSGLSQGKNPVTGERSGKRLAPNANHHPTVKPVKLMRYLCRLITPPGGTVLDPFMGSGTTGVAALKEGFDFIGIEREAEYAEIARKRIETQHQI